MMIQVMTEAQAEKTSYNPFDLTKVWPHGEFPVKEVGIMELNRNPGELLRRGRTIRFLPGQPVRASATARTRCSSSASSRTPTPTVIAGRHYENCRSTARTSGEFISSRRPLRFDGNEGWRSTTNRTVSADRRRSRLQRAAASDRRDADRTTIGWATTISRRPGISIA